MPRGLSGRGGEWAVLELTSTQKGFDTVQFNCSFSTFSHGMEFFQDPCNLSGNSNKASNIVFGLTDQKNHPQGISIPSVRRVWIFPELHNFETCHLNVHVAEAEWSSRTNPLLFHPKHELKVIFFIFLLWLK